MSFLSGSAWWAACDAAYSLRQGRQVVIRPGGIQIDGHWREVEDPDGVLSEAVRMAGVDSTPNTAHDDHSTTTPEEATQ